jgi:uncharacterized protein YneF (UPF0154 family)
MAILFTALFLLFLLALLAGFFFARRRARSSANRSTITRRIRNV